MSSVNHRLKFETFLFHACMYTDSRDDIAESRSPKCGSDIKSNPTLLAVTQCIQNQKLTLTLVVSERT